MVSQDLEATIVEFTTTDIAAACSAAGVITVKGKARTVRPALGGRMCVVWHMVPLQSLQLLSSPVPACTHMTHTHMTHTHI